MPKLTKMCYGCRQEFRKSELVDYTSPAAKISHSYCPNCLKEKQEREAFSEKVCSIFGIKSPGPRIWNDRKRLIEKFGYTDDIIIDCLDYVYNVEKQDKKVESLYLVNPVSVERMRKFKRDLEAENRQIARALSHTQVKEYIAPIQENIDEKKEWNPDDWLNLD